MNEYFPKSFRNFGRNINVKVDLSNYTTKTEVDKLDIDKLAPVPVDLSKLSAVVKNDIVKKLHMIN